MTSGTFCERVRIPLRLWYEIAYCFALGLPALRAQKVLKIEEYRPVYKAYMTIRMALEQKSYELFKEKIKWKRGGYELDEAFFGGKFKNKRKKVKKELYDKGLVKRGRGAVYLQQPVFGIYKRNGMVFLELVANTGKATIEPIIENRIVKGARVYSDRWKAYDGLMIKGYIHKRVDHGKDEYVTYEKKEAIHVNGIEGFWGLSKSGMHRYKGIKKKNWKYYLKEFEFRYNHRDLEYEEMADKIIEILFTFYEKSRGDYA
ncbi:MAG: IS1595 family transposase [Acidobacteriota bacterium]|nr:IS1595 family transposase [Acidobacteriota bacterium]